MRRAALLGALLVLFVRFSSRVFCASGLPSSSPVSLALIPDPEKTPVYAHDRMEFRIAPPAADARPLRIRLIAPSSKWWVSTDFPVVEGTTLLEWETEPDAGEVKFAYRLPIRGRYRLEVARPSPESPGGFVPAGTFSFEIHEQPRKRRNLLVALTGIFLLGGLCGYKFSRSSSG